LTDVRLRDGVAADAALAAAIQERASVAGLAHVFPPELYPYPRAAIRERWTELLAAGEHHVLVAEHDDEVLGVVAVRRGWLDGLYVVPEAWGTGIAGELHDAVLDHLRGLDETECRLWVLEENARARRFYERRSWELDGTTRVVPYPPSPLDVGYTIRL
jgi:RimJ/RimL family protein N-acetyltransferase